MTIGTVLRSRLDVRSEDYRANLEQMQELWDKVAAEQATELAQQEVSAAFDDITAAVERTGAAAESTAEKMARLGRTGRDCKGLCHRM